MMFCQKKLPRDFMWGRGVGSEVLLCWGVFLGVKKGVLDIS